MLDGGGPLPSDVIAVSQLVPAVQLRRTLKTAAVAETTMNTTTTTKRCVMSSEASVIGGVRRHTCIWRSSAERSCARLKVRMASSSFPSRRRRYACRKRNGTAFLEKAQPMAGCRREGASGPSHTADLAAQWRGCDGRPRSPRGKISLPRATPAAPSVLRLHKFRRCS